MRPANAVAEAIFFEAVSNLGLTPRQADVLTAVARTGARSQIALTVVLSMDPTTMSKVCRRLVRKGLIRRRRLPEDTRVLVATLTPAGLVVLAEIEAAATRARRAAEDVMGTIEHLCMGPFAEAPPFTVPTVR